VGIEKMNILDKAKENADGLKKSVQQKSLERQIRQLEHKKQKAQTELVADMAEKARIEEEKNKIFEERKRLSELSTNEILAEAIMALRGFCSKFEELEDSYRSIDSRIGDLESDIDSLRTEIYNAANNSSSTDY